MTILQAHTQNGLTEAPWRVKFQRVNSGGYRLRLVPQLGPIFDGEPEPIPFVKLLDDILKFEKDEFVSVCYAVKSKQTPFRTAAVCSPADASSVIAALPNGADIWFGINPTRGPAHKGGKRGGDVDVTRLATLAADLDIKEGACADRQTAEKIIDDLSSILGVRPSAVTFSGNGLHPYWPISDGRANADEIKALSIRWKDLVGYVAEKYNAKTDNVFDPARVLRVPGTFNNKANPIPVTCHANGYAALTMAQIDRILTREGFRPLDDYPEIATEAKRKQVESEIASWEFSDETCSYAEATIKGWSDPDTVEKGTARHQWHLSKSVKLYCMKKLGCISENDFKQAQAVLTSTVIHLCNIREPKRSVPDGEIERAWKLGRNKAALKTKTEAKKELGDHKHTKPVLRSQASRLVDIALDSYKLGISPEGRSFGYNPDLPHVALDLRGSKLGLQPALARDYFRAFNSVPTQTAVKSAMGVLEGIAREQKPVTVNLRVAGDAQVIHIDMADENNRVIEISQGKWRIINESPYMFRRTELTAPVIEPMRVGDVSKLWSYLNICDDDRPLTLAVLVDALIQPNTAKPVVGFTGEHGTAKTASSTRFVSLIDPSVLEEGHSPPKDLEHWLSIAQGSWVVSLDNLSNISDWLSDAFCRAATGGGNAKRTLFTDDNLSVYKFRRVVIFNGISLEGLRGDLADRLISFELHPISKRETDTNLTIGWKRDYPEIFGGLLDLAAQVQRMLPTLPDEPLPRMADFARVIICIDKIYGTDAMKRYYERQTWDMSKSATDDSLIQCLIASSYNTKGEYKTATEILNYANMKWSQIMGTDQKSNDWPRSPKTVTALLKRNAPALRKMGWALANDEGRNHDHVLKWKMAPPSGSDDDA